MSSMDFKVIKLPNEHLDLTKIFKILKDNNCTIEQKDVYDIMTPEGKSFVSIFLQDKYIFS